MDRLAPPFYSSRRFLEGEAAMANVLSRDQQLAVLNLLVEGVALRSITRITGVHRTTVQNLLVRVGGGCQALLDAEMRGLTLRHVQMDEIWTFCRKKQQHLRPEERDDPAVGDQYLFVALDTDTKLIPSYALGKRDGFTTQRFIDDLAGRIVTPGVNAPYSAKPQLSTDGWPCYPGAIEVAFGSHVQYGQVIKHFGDSEQPGRYAPPEVVSTERRRFQGIADLLSICTSHVERNNLTIRLFVKRFARLTLAFSKKVDNLFAAISLHVAHYNYVRRHGSLRVTPAMAAGVTDHLWTISDLYDAAT